MKEAIIQYNDTPSASHLDISWEPLVRCKDCIWYDKEDPGYTTGICKMNDRMFPKEHFFCAHGFKRSEDGE